MFLLQKQDFKMALRKYRKALRYLDICWEKDDIDEGVSFVLSCYAEN
jgi:peptidyl-prolyl isomerase D